MIETWILPIILALITSSTVATLIVFFVKRHDEKHDKNASVLAAIEGIDKKLVKVERDNCRTQMLLLMSDYPNEKAELMKLAQHYFGDLEGDWYMTGMFNQWLEKMGIGKPEWFNSEG